MFPITSWRNLTLPGPRLCWKPAAAYEFENSGIPGGTVGVSNRYDYCSAHHRGPFRTIRRMRPLRTGATWHSHRIALVSAQEDRAQRSN